MACAANRRSLKKKKAGGSAGLFLSTMTSVQETGLPLATGQLLWELEAVRIQFSSPE
jgi:hypothetical protein